MYSINSENEFNYFINEQRALVQKKLDHYSGKHILPRNERDILFKIISIQGKEIHSYFRKANHGILTNNYR